MSLLSNINQAILRKKYKEKKEIFKDINIISVNRTDSDVYTTLCFILNNDKKIVVSIASMKDRPEDADIIIPTTAQMVHDDTDNKKPLNDNEREQFIIKVMEFAINNKPMIYFK
jgi:hypothetical protein